MLLDRFCSCLPAGGPAAAAFMGCLIALSGTAFAARSVSIGNVAVSDRPQIAIGPASQAFDRIEVDKGLNYPVIVAGRATFDQLNLLAEAGYAEGHYKEAEHWLLAACVIARNAFPASDPAFAQATANLALVYKAEGRTFDTIVMLTRAIRAAEIALGPRDAWVARLTAHLAVIYAEKGKLEEAQLLFQRAIAIEESIPGQDGAFLSQAVRNLSMVLRQSRLAEAQALVEHSLNLQLSAYGANPPAVAGVPNALLAVQGASFELGDESFHSIQRTSAAQQEPAR
jgi:tetratricopeptide (TPR) repeat protein